MSAQSLARVIIMSLTSAKQRKLSLMAKVDGTIIAYPIDEVSADC